MEIFVLTGPTAVGKTNLAIDWAIQHNAEILSCDSLCLYQGMNIGTAKPNAQQLTAVKHHGINLVPVNHQYNIKEFIDYAKAIVQDVHARGKKLLVCGGTGFYLKSFYEATVDTFECDPNITQQVRQWHDQHGSEWLLNELKKLNPSGLENLDIHNPRRVMKALERCLSTGQEHAALITSFQSQPGPFDQYTKHTTLLLRDRNELNTRIHQRTLQMIQDGLVEEVKLLLDAGITENPSATHAIGYRETIAYIQDGDSLQSLPQAISQNTQKLVAKQLKWFRRQIPIDQKIDLTHTTYEKALETLFQGL